MKLIQSVEDQNVIYLSIFDDRIRLKFEDGEYKGWYET